MQPMPGLAQYPEYPSGSHSPEETVTLAFMEHAFMEHVLHELQTIVLVLCMDGLAPPLEAGPPPASVRWKIS